MYVFCYGWSTIDVNVSLSTSEIIGKASFVVVVHGGVAYFLYQ